MSDRTGRPDEADSIRQRLEQARGAVERIWTPAKEDTRRVLEERALRLAYEPRQTDAAEYIEVLEFFLSHERYAIETKHVREAHALEDITPVPCTPAFVFGIANVRGEIFSVIDLRKFFDLPEQGLTDLNKIIVLESPDMVFGIVADAIAGVGLLARAGIQPPLPTLTGMRERYLLGVTAAHTAVLDAEKLLHDEKLVVRELAEE